MVVQPTTNVRLWCIGVPDLTEVQGGTKVMINGLNMKFVADHQQIVIDGRTSKHMTYDATYHTNKIRMVVKHDAGSKFEFELIWEHFKA